VRASLARSRRATASPGWFDDKLTNANVDRRAWLNVVTDALPAQERQVVNLLYFEGVSIRDAARVMGMDHRSMRRVRDRALERLQKYFGALETAEFKTARKIIALKMPEGGAEHAVIYETHHRCPQANALARDVGDDCDLLVFPVGNSGYGMPKGIPFDVIALGPCQACGADVGAWFVWAEGSPRHYGTIWTPNQEGGA
jgi:hypothetical protein